MSKHCPRCNSDYPETTEFWRKDAGSRDGYYCYCKKCCAGIRTAPAPKGGTKPCSLCKAELPANEDYFRTKKNGKYGLRAKCRQCERNERALPESIEKSKKRRRTPHYRALMLKYSRTQRRKEYQKEYRQSEKYREYIKEDRLSESYRNRIARYTHSTKGKITALKNTRKRQTRKLGLPFSWTVADWEFCLEYWGNRCCVCGREADSSRFLAQDHWIPLTDNSPENPGTVPWNIVPLCHTRRRAGNVGSCNLSKLNNSPVVWLRDTFANERVREIQESIEVFFSVVKQRNATCTTEV